MFPARAPVIGVVLLALAGPVFALSDGFYSGGHEYLPVKDDAELGETLLFDIVAQGFGLALRDAIELHNDYDLYPEEVAMVLYLARESREGYEDIAEDRADERYSWKELARRLDIDPDRFGQPSTWYRMGDRDEWWREDPDVEREVITDLLAGAFGVDRRVVWDWVTDGLGYGDAALALEFERRSGEPADSILRTKMDRQERWDEVADALGIGIEDLYAKRSLHYHDRDFRPYLKDDDRDYHSRRDRREHRSRREYHFYGTWQNPRDSYFRYAYAVDYDPYFSFGRAPYAYWYPPDWDYACVYPSWHWTSSIYHPIPRPIPVYSPGRRPVRPPCSPTAPLLPPVRDTRRYAVQLLDTGSRSVAIPGGSASRGRSTSGRLPVERSSSVSRSSASRPAEQKDEARQSTRDRQREAERSERSATRKGGSSSSSSAAPVPRGGSSGSSPGTPRGGVSRGGTPRGSASPPPSRGESSARRGSPPKSSDSSSNARRSSPPKEAPKSAQSARPSSPERSSPPASPPSSPSGRGGSRKGGR